MVERDAVPPGGRLWRQTVGGVCGQEITEKFVQGGSPADNRDGNRLGGQPRGGGGGGWTGVATRSPTQRQLTPIMEREGVSTRSPTQTAHTYHGGGRGAGCLSDWFRTRHPRVERRDVITQHVLPTHPQHTPGRPKYRHTYTNTDPAPPHTHTEYIPRVKKKGNPNSRG